MKYYNRFKMEQNSQKFNLKNLNWKIILGSIGSGLIFSLILVSYIVYEDSKNFKLKSQASQTSSINMQNIEVTGNNSTSASRSSIKAKPKYKIFSGLEFQALYEKISQNYENVNPINVRPTITGNVAADSKIQTLAENRGYKIRSEAIDKKINTKTETAFSQLKQAAKTESDLDLVLVSGFRSIEAQRNIFKNQLGNAFTNSQIANGKADDKINKVLESSSPPGYSRHHSGYTIDLGCKDDNLTNFKNTACFSWLSKNNYENSRRFGFIPSYPEGAINQGPNPEEWEYVWVGKDNLR